MLRLPQPLGRVTRRVAVVAAGAWAAAGCARAPVATPAVAEPPAARTTAAVEHVALTSKGNRYEGAVRNGQPDGRWQIECADGVIHRLTYRAARLNGPAESWIPPAASPDGRPRHVRAAFRDGHPDGTPDDESSAGAACLLLADRQVRLAVEMFQLERRIEQLGAATGGGMGGDGPR